MSASLRLAAATSTLPVVAALACLHGAEDPLRESEYWPFEGNSAVVPFAIGTALAWSLYYGARRRRAGRLAYLAVGLVSGSVAGTFYALAPDSGDLSHIRITGMFVIGMLFGSIASQLVYNMLNQERVRT